MSVLFRRAKQNRIFQDVVAHIQSAILDGKIKPGDKLPAKRELGERIYRGGIESKGLAACMACPPYSAATGAVD